MDNYLVYSSEIGDGSVDVEDVIAVVEAENELEAKHKYATYRATKEREFYSHCLLGLQYFNCEELYRNDELELKDGLTEEDEREAITIKIREYFKGSNLADDFIREYFDYDNIESKVLPIDILTFYILKLDEDEEDFIIVKPLDDYRIK